MLSYQERILSPLIINNALATKDCNVEESRFFLDLITIYCLDEDIAPEEYEDYAVNLLNYFYSEN